MRLFRNYDRQLHQANYPALSYPELYLVYGGYSQFYEPHSVSIRYWLSSEKYFDLFFTPFSSHSVNNPFCTDTPFKSRILTVLHVFCLFVLFFIAVL
jgi:hypothetical protein